MYRFNHADSKLFKVFSKFAIGSKVGRDASDEDGACWQRLGGTKQEFAADAYIITIVYKGEIERCKAKEVGEK